MGASNSKAEKNEVLRLCKERRRFIKQAIDSRYAFAASHVSYIQSLGNIGLALRRYAEAEVLIESSLSTSATEIDKTSSHCSYPSPSPSHIAEVPDSPLHNESHLPPQPVFTANYMKSGGGATAVTVRFNPSRSNGFVENDSVAFQMPPPPPPPDSASSWDYFDTTDDSESFRFVGHSAEDLNFDDEVGWGQSKREEADLYMEEGNGKWAKTGSNEGFCKSHLDHKVSEDSRQPVVSQLQPILGTESNANGARDCTGKHCLETSSSKKAKKVVGKDLCAEREDPSEFITHRAKDFISSIKDIENRFVKASESGREVSRMLEANKIRVGYSEAKGNSSAPAFLVAFHHACCRGKSTLVSSELPLQGTKVITWKRSTSSRSSSSRKPLTSASKDDADDSGSDFIEEFCMIAGNHSSTLDRLYAWERKLYDEVKASESIQKVYDQKCNQLRHQFAKDCSSHVIDKTRAVAKDLHSRIRVAIQSVDSISKRIEKMRDEELQPQLLELIQGLIRMWKAMLECHHTQYITISLAYHSRSSKVPPEGDTRRQIMAQLQSEVECFGLSFADWINNLTSYVEALNGWLLHSIAQPREPRERSSRSSKKPFSPRKALAPPIFVLCRDWSAGIRALSSNELSDAIKTFMYELHHITVQQGEESQKQQSTKEVTTNGGSEPKDEEGNDNPSTNLYCIQTSLTKVLDRMTKFSEASLKMYEDVKQKSEMARIAYSNGKPGKY